MSAFKSSARYNQKKREVSPSKNFIYSPLSIEDDQKGIIILKLKEEITLLKHNQGQFEQLKDHYKGLNHEYNGLLKEKKGNDEGFAKHHEAALRQISQMKNEIDSMKADQREKKLKIEDLRTDENTLKSELDLKYIEIEKLKNDLNSAIADNEQLCNERTKLGNIHQQVSDERQRRSQEANRLNENFEKVQEKIKEIEGYWENLSREEKIITDQILRYEEDNNQIDEDISITEDDLAILGTNIEESNRTIQELQNRLAGTNSQSEKLKSQALHFKKSAQAEVMRNNDAGKNIAHSQNLLDVRKNQVKEGHREIESLNEQNVSLEKINTQLDDDLEACKRHLQNLAMINNNLVNNMQQISSEDEEVRHIVDRRVRVEMAMERVSECEQGRKGTTYTQQETRTRESSSRSSPYSSSRMRKYEI